MLHDYWWEQPAFEAHIQAAALIEGTRERQANIYVSYLRNTRFYLDENISGFEPGEWNPGGNSLMAPSSWGDSGDYELVPNPEDFNWNLVKANVDAVIASTCTRAPDIRFLPNSASRATQRKTTLLEKYTRGIKKASKADKALRSARKDAAVCGTGFIKAYADKDEDNHARIRIERVHPHYVTMPEQSSLLGDSSWIAQHSYMSKDQLFDFIEDFVPPRKKTSIKYDAEQVNFDDTGLIRVYEIWHKQKRHIIFTDTFTLVDEDWNYTWTPFIKTVWEAPLLGQHGVSHVHGLIPIQRELRMMLEKRSIHMDVLSNAFATVKKGDALSKEMIEHLDRFSILEVSDPGAVHFQIPDGDHPSWVNYIEELWRKSFEIKGSNPETAQGRKDSGLTAGIAIRLAKDIQSERHSEYTDGWAQLHVEVTQRIIKLSKITPGLSTKGAGSFVETIKWKDVDLSDDLYDISLDAANALSRSSAGRYDTILELSQATDMPQEVLLGLLQHPDVDKYLKRQAAPRNAIESFFERTIETSDILPIPKWFNLDQFVQIGNQIYSDLMDNAAPQEEIDIVETLMEEAMMLLNPPAPPAPEASAPGPEMPPMPEGPMPPMPPEPGPMVPSPEPPTSPEGLPTEPPPLPEPLPPGMPAAGPGVPVEPQMPM